MLQRIALCRKLPPPTHIVTGFQNPFNNLQQQAVFGLLLWIWTSNPLILTSASKCSINLVNEHPPLCVDKQQNTLKKALVL